MLSDPIFEPLRCELSRQNITTVDALRKLKLWPFMNHFCLYTIGTRQKVAAQVQAILSPETHASPEDLYVLHLQSTAYKGNTPAETFLEFCKDISHKYPLRIRRLIDVPIYPNGPVAIHREDTTHTFLKMEYPLAFIDPSLETAAVLKMAHAICQICGESIMNITMDEPQMPKAAPQIMKEQSKPIVKRPPMVPPSPVAAKQPPLHPEVTQKTNPLIALAEQRVLCANTNGLAIETLQDELLTTMLATKQIVACAKHIVEINGHLYHDSVLIGWEEAAKSLALIMDKLMQKNHGYVSSAQLYEYARVEMHMFLNDNDMDNERAVYDLSQHLFDKIGYNDIRYKFYGKAHISQLSNAISSNFDVICKFARDQENFFTFADLEEYLAGISIKTGNLRNQMKVYSDSHFLYYQEGVLLSTESMAIDENWKADVKNALMKLFADVGDHIILREIESFWFDQLPPLPGSRPWTPMLLQNVLRFYGEELEARTIVAMETQSIETLHTMLVRNDSPIQNFGDAVIAYLMENDIEERSFEAESLRGLLVKSGMIRGNELIWNMPKALGGDERFAWDASGTQVSIKV